MKNKTRNVAWLSLAVFVVLGIGLYAIRQNILNSRLLDAIQQRQAASVVQDLIHQGANPNAVGTSEYDSALFRAIHVASPQTVKVLLDAEASVQPVGEAKVTPMTAVAFSNMAGVNQFTEAEYRAVIQQLQSRGESIKEKDTLGDTPLMRAIWAGNTVAIKPLLDAGADTHTVNNQGQTIWDWTGNILVQRAETVELLHLHDKSTRRS